MGFILTLWEWFRYSCCGPRRRLVEQDLNDQGTSPNLTTPLLVGPDEDPAVSDISSTSITMFLTEYEAFRRAAEGLDGEGRLMLLKEMHRAPGESLDLYEIARGALQHDDLPCFLYIHDNGGFFTSPPMVYAAAYGALSILEYGFRHKDDIVWRTHPWYSSRPNTWEQALCGAAACGHLACVRFLHKRGVRMWVDVKISDFGDWFGSMSNIMGWDLGNLSCLIMPESEHLVESLWGVLRYGELHGAWLPESAVCILRERRARAREVMLCFQCAARLSRGGGEHSHLWGVMALGPRDVVYTTLVVADLEIEEAFTRRALTPMAKQALLWL